MPNDKVNTPNPSEAREFWLCNNYIWDSAEKAMDHCKAVLHYKAEVIHVREIITRPTSTPPDAVQKYTKLVSDADIDALAIRFEDCWRSCDTRTAIREVILPYIEQHATPSLGATGPCGPLGNVCKDGVPGHIDKDGKFTPTQHATPSSATSEIEPEGWVEKRQLDKMQCGELPYAGLYCDGKYLTGAIPLYASPHPIERQAGEFVSVPRELLQRVRSDINNWYENRDGIYAAEIVCELDDALAAAPAQAAQGNTKDKNKI